MFEGRSNQVPFFYFLFDLLWNIFLSSPPYLPWYIGAQFILGAVFSFLLFPNPKNS